MSGGVCSEEQHKECSERRHTDINVWEKRITLWFMAALVSIATAQVVEMNTNMKVIQKEIDTTAKKNDHQDGRLEALASEQGKIKLGLNGHEIRLESVEEKLKVTASKDKPKGTDFKYP